jgi:hypothetical protein
MRIGLDVTTLVVGQFTLLSQGPEVSDYMHISHIAIVELVVFNLAVTCAPFPKPWCSEPASELAPRTNLPKDGPSRCIEVLVWNNPGWLSGPF